MSFDRVKLTTQNDSVSSPSAASSAPRRLRMREVEETATQPTIMPVKKESMQNVPPKITALVLVLVLLFGIGTGLGVARYSAARGGVVYTSVEQAGTADVEDAIKAGAIFGVPDEKTFRDQAEGVLIKGGLEGEGSHTLLRPGGVSQNVYLTSSVVDLDQFENASVRIWGETFKGQKAGWLMDVGRLEIIELSAEKPSWYQEKTDTNAKDE